jgi:hypothetical protein
MRLYSNQATTIHKAFKDKLGHMVEFEVEGGVAWVLTEKPWHTYEHFNVLENELAKQLRITLC